MSRVPVRAARYRPRHTERKPLTGPADAPFGDDRSRQCALRHEQARTPRPFAVATVGKRRPGTVTSLHVGVLAVVGDPVDAQLRDDLTVTELLRHRTHSDCCFLKT